MTATPTMPSSTTKQKRVKKRMKLQQHLLESFSVFLAVTVVAVLAEAGDVMVTRERMMQRSRMKMKKKKFFGHEEQHVMIRKKMRKRTMLMLMSVWVH